MAVRPKICVICEICVTLYISVRKYNQRAQTLDFIFREITHDETPSETQHQNDDGEYHGCGVGSVLHILLGCAQLEKHAQG